MNVLITARAGYIGSQSAVSHIKVKHEVTLFNNFSNSDLSVINCLEKIVGRKIAYEVVARRERDLPAYFAKVDFAKSILIWKRKRYIESMWKSLWEFKESDFQ
jgi:UDP-glucose 4-epimerase